MSIRNSIWDWEIKSNTGYWGHSLKELWQYRHLLFGLVRRHFLLYYHQTILGPIWILFQPILTLVTYILVFNKLVGISTGSLPPVLFYASGIILWNFFSDGFTGTASTFKENAQVFSKVYFPRIIMPMSVISTHFVRFLLQLVMFFVLVAYYYVFEGIAYKLTGWIFAFPVAILMIGLLGLGMGLFFSIVTAKYRDFNNVVLLGVRLLMFVTPVVYPMVAIPEKTRWIVQLNPLTAQFELFRLAFLGQGTVTPYQLLYSAGFTILLLVGSILFFNKQGDKLIDIV